MPELPEVESARGLLTAHAVGRTIAAVTAADDTIVIQGVSGVALAAALTGARVLRVQRKGKHLWWELDRRPWPSFHFGMTGSFVVRGVAAPRYQSFAVDESAWPPRFHKLLLTLSDATELAFVDARRFARIRLHADPPAEPPISELGWDPILNPPSPEAFAAQLARRAAPIKAVLLDQGVAAGVGNWVADEALYAARVHPETPARALGGARAAALLQALRGVCEAAVAVDADSERFPPGWLFHRRWHKKPGNSAEGHPLAFLTVGGRTSCFVPALQKKSGGGDDVAVGAEAVEAAAPASGAKRASASAAAAPKRKRAAKAADADAPPPPPAAAAAAAAPPKRGSRAAAAPPAMHAVAAVARRVTSRLRAL